MSVARLKTKTARAALRRAERAARNAGIAALTAEVESAALVLKTPAARLIAHGKERLLRLQDVEALLASGALVVDACRYAVRDVRTLVSLARRPVLFTLARVLGEAWPGDASRGALDALAAAGKVQSFGRGRSRRWLTPPVPGIATTLLLPAPLPTD